METNGVEVVRVHNRRNNKSVLWLRSKDTEEKLDVENIYDLIDKEIKGRFGTNNPTKQQIRKYKIHAWVRIN